MESIDIVILLQNTSQRFQNRLLTHELKIDDQLKIDQNNIVLADKDAMTRVFLNIFENAHRYVTTPGTVTLSNYYSNDKVVLQIDDTGPGVPDHTLDHLFDRLFTIEDSRNKKRSGSGLGLSIARSIVDAHQGSIHAEKNEVGGLKIVIELPLSKIL